MAIYLQKLQGGKNRKWRGHVRVHGYPNLSKTFRLRSEAQEWAETTEEEMFNGCYSKPNKATVNDLIDRYIEEVLNHRKNQGGMQKYYLNWWRKKIGSRQIKHILGPVLEDLRSKMRKRPNKYGKPQSASNINSYFSLISAVFRN